jgi:glycosyltransferase involved in cell wall biosynthesis
MTATILLVGEGDLSHGTLLQRLADGLSTLPDTDVRAVTIGRPRGPEAPLVANLRPLGRFDLQPLRWRLRYSLRARRVLSRHRGEVDVALVNTQSCALLSKRPMRQVPTVLSVDITGRQFARMDFWGRGIAPSAGERPLESLERRAYNSAAKVLAWSEWTARSVVEEYGVAADRVTHLHFGVDLPELRTPAADESRSLQLLFVGNFTRRKGLDTLLAALAQAGRGLELHVVTNDPLPPDPAVHVHRGLEPGGEALRERFRQADVFVLPTRADAVPWVVAEAMAAGLPVVASPVGAIPEMVGDAGILVPVGDATALAGALEQLRDEPQLIRELGARARRRAEEHYDRSRQLPKLLELVRACV